MIEDDRRYGADARREVGCDRSADDLLVILRVAEFGRECVVPIADEELSAVPRCTDERRVVTPLRRQVDELTVDATFVRRAVQVDRRKLQ